MEIRLKWRQQTEETFKGESEKQRSSYRSEDHVQRHGDVEVESVVVDHADCEEHCHHDHIVTEGEKKIVVCFSVCLSFLQQEI